jgi:Putative auto-transporter adhesin, head GIN domain
MLASAAATPVPAREVVIERSVAVSAFSSVGIAGWQDADITVGPATSVKIRGAKTLVDQTVIEWRNNALSIRSKNNSWGNWSDGDGVTVVITTPSLNRVAISGSGDIKARGIKAGDFGVSISGSGDVKLSGSCANFKSSISGSGDVDASGLSCTNGSLNVAGSGDTSIRLSGDVNSVIAGSGDMTIYGNPKGNRKQNVAGSGEVMFK